MATSTMKRLAARYRHLALMADTTPAGTAAAQVFHVDAWMAACTARDASPADQRAEWEARCERHRRAAGR